MVTGAMPRTLPFQSTSAPGGAVWMRISTGLGGARLISGSDFCVAAQALRSRAEKSVAAGTFIVPLALVEQEAEWLLMHGESQKASAFGSPGPERSPPSANESGASSGRMRDLKKARFPNRRAKPWCARHGYRNASPRYRWWRSALHRNGRSAGASSAWNDEESIRPPARQWLHNRLRYRRRRGSQNPQMPQCAKAVQHRCKQREAVG